MNERYLTFPNMHPVAWWNGARWVADPETLRANAAPDPIVGEAERADTCADIDRALGPALDPLIRRMLPGRLPRAREAVRKEIVEYIADVLGAEQAQR